MMIRSVIFDLGGVVLESPFAAIAEFEREEEIEGGLMGRLVAAGGSDGAWARLERGEIELARFFGIFEAEMVQGGLSLSAIRLMEAIERSMHPRPAMLAAVSSLRASGYAVAALTNNWAGGQSMAARFAELAQEFDVFVESYKVGRRKPEPEIYLHTCRLLSIAPTQAVFLDDIGANLKAARKLGIFTIKVGDPARALEELATVLQPHWRR